MKLGVIRWYSLRADLGRADQLGLLSAPDGCNPEGCAVGADLLSLCRLSSCDRISPISCKSLVDHGENY